MDDIQKIRTALSRIEQGTIKAYSEGDRVLFLIQNAPDELRELATALEALDVDEVQALVTYEKAPDQAQKSGRLPSPSSSSSSSGTSD